MVLIIASLFTQTLDQRFGERIQLTASREVVLSAGSVGTPQILLLSGIGDQDHLREVSFLVAKCVFQSFA